MPFESILSENAPAAIGPYVHASKVGNLLYTSGALGIIPGQPQLLEGIEAQTKQALTNLEGILKTVGATKDKVAKCNVYVKDLNDFAALNKTYGEFFEPHKPARTCVQVAKLPLDALVEIEAIAVLD